MDARGKVIVGVAVGLAAFVILALAALVTGFPSVGAPEALLLLIPLVILANFVVIVAAVVHALVRDDLTGIQRLVWIAISIFVTPVVAVGAIVYFAMGRARTRETFADLGRAAG